jgi:hypothetical protein
MLSNIKRLITERQYEKYKALHNKFVKACGITLDGISSMMKGNLAQNKNQSESSWNPDSENNDRNKGLFSKVGKKKSLISIEEESENYD